MRPRVRLDCCVPLPDRHRQWCVSPLSSVGLSRLPFFGPLYLRLRCRRFLLIQVLALAFSIVSRSNLVWHISIIEVACAVPSYNVRARRVVTSGDYTYWFGLGPSSRIFGRWSFD